MNDHQVDELFKIIKSQRKRIAVLENDVRLLGIPSNIPVYPVPYNPFPFWDTIRYTPHISVTCETRTDATDYTEAITSLKEAKTEGTIPAIKLFDELGI